MTDERVALYQLYAHDSRGGLDYVQMADKNGGYRDDEG
jgi:hypothetical protein